MISMACYPMQIFSRNAQLFGTELCRCPLDRLLCSLRRNYCLYSLAWGWSHHSLIWNLFKRLICEKVELMRVLMPTVMWNTSLQQLM